VGELVSSFGKKPLVLADRIVYSEVGEVLSHSLSKENLVPTFGEFQGECSTKETERITKLLKKKRIDVVIGCGGGKAIDVAKVAAYNTGLPIITFQYRSSHNHFSYQRCHLRWLVFYCPSLYRRRSLPEDPGFKKKSGFSPSRS